MCVLVLAGEGKGLLKAKAVTLFQVRSVWGRNGENQSAFHTHSLSLLSLSLTLTLSLAPSLSHPRSLPRVYCV